MKNLKFVLPMSKTMYFLHYRSCILNVVFSYCWWQFCFSRINFCPALYSLAKSTITNTCICEWNYQQVSKFSTLCKLTICKRWSKLNLWQQLSEQHWRSNMSHYCMVAEIRFVILSLMRYIGSHVAWPYVSFRNW